MVFWGRVDVQPVNVMLSDIAFGVEDGFQARGQLPQTVNEGVGFHGDGGLGRGGLEPVRV